MDRETLRDQILLSILPNVAFDGWTERALKFGVEGAGYDAAMAVRAFPGGVPEVLEHFSAWADRQMLVAVEAEGEGFRDRPLGDKIAIALQARLETIAPYREAVRRSAGVLAQPQNGPIGARMVYRTMDAVWHAAGDRATDFSFYTKRGVLAGVYGATLVFWLNDKSEDNEATWRFLRGRLRDVVAMGTVAERLPRVSPVLEAPFRLFGLLRSGIDTLRGNREAA